MAFTVSSTKSTSGRREGKMNGQEITEVTTFLTNEFRHGPRRSRQDESGTGRELALSLLLGSKTHPQGCGSGKGQWMGWYWFSHGTLCYFRILNLRDILTFLIFVYLHYYFSLATTFYTSVQTLS